MPLPALQLTLYAIYYSPEDFPGLYVMRPFICTAGRVMASPVAYSGQTLREVRAKVPLGLMRTPRAPKDQPHLVETWF